MYSQRILTTVCVFVCVLIISQRLSADPYDDFGSMLEGTAEELKRLENQTKGQQSQQEPANQESSQEAIVSKISERPDN